MQRTLIAVMAGLLLALMTGVGSALAGNDNNPIGSLTQSQNAGNSVSQDANAHSGSLNLAPNLALLNQGSTTQSSGSAASANAGNANSSTQSNDQTQTADQTASGGKGGEEGCTCSQPQGDDGSQSLDQTQNADNSIDQTAQAKAVSVNVGPNVALLNQGDTRQSSGSAASANAGNVNSSTQSNDQTQTADQSGNGKDGGDQSLDQTQNADNSIDQTAQAKAVSVNVGPNVALLNQGDTRQSSGSAASANAGNVNSSTQSNDQTQTADQSGNGKDGGDQSLDQTQNADNSIDQTAQAKAVSVNVGPNIAAGNGYGGKNDDCRCSGKQGKGGKGGTSQWSGAGASANAGNWNRSSQSNDQTQTADQSGKGKDGGDQSLDQTQNAQNSIDQTAKAKAYSFNLSPNIAAFDEGKTKQSSGSEASAKAGNWNHSTQSNTQSQTGTQKTTGGGRCCPPPCEPCPPPPPPCCDPCKVVLI